MKIDTMQKGIETLALCQAALEAIVEKAGIDHQGFTACRNLEGAAEEARLTSKALKACETFNYQLRSDQ